MPKFKNLDFHKSNKLDPLIKDACQFFLDECEKSGLDGSIKTRRWFGNTCLFVIKSEKPRFDFTLESDSSGLLWELFFFRDKTGNNGMYWSLHPGGKQSLTNPSKIQGTQYEMRHYLMNFVWNPPASSEFYIRRNINSFIQIVKFCQSSNVFQFNFHLKEVPSDFDLVQTGFIPPEEERFMREIEDFKDKFIARCLKEKLAPCVRDYDDYAEFNVIDIELGLEFSLWFCKYYSSTCVNCFRRTPIQPDGDWVGESWSEDGVVAKWTPSGVFKKHEKLSKLKQKADKGCHQFSSRMELNDKKEINDRLDLFFDFVLTCVQNEEFRKDIIASINPYLTPS